MPRLTPPTLGVILAGGRARRMGGGDKPLLKLRGRALIQHVAERLASQCEGLILSANGDPARFAGISVPVVPDPLPDHPGPLAGILAAMEWAAAHHSSVEWVASVPGDSPFVPEDLVLRLHKAREAASLPLACASSDSRIHFAAGLWPVCLRHDLRHGLATMGVRSVRDWASGYGMALASWPSEPVDPFFNVNTPDDLAEADTLVEQMTAWP